jgi:D-glycero-D-manno-heptose 1,7-bisphosphate phosphatase
MLNKALLLDRDGTLILEKTPGMLPKDVQLIPGVLANLRQARLDGFRLLLVTNMSSVGLGLITEAHSRAVFRAMHKLLHDGGAPLDDVYVCDHSPDEECYCRKPMPGLLHLAMAEHDVDARESWVIGDRETDIKAGERVYGMNTHRVAKNHPWKLPYRGY